MGSEALLTLPLTPAQARDWYRRARLATNTSNDAEHDALVEMIDAVAAGLRSVAIARGAAATEPEPSPHSGADLTRARLDR